jgi:hypothetical protein
MSCDTNRTTVHLDDDRQGRHRHRDDDFETLRDLFALRANDEDHRDILVKVLEVGQANLRETMEAKFAAVKETIESKAEVLAAIAEARADGKESKHDLAVKILETQLANEKGLREILCRPRERGCGHGHD